MKRRIVSLLMALALCLSLLPTAALATEVEPVEQPPVEQPAEVVPAPEGGEEEPAEQPAEEEPAEEPEEVPEEPVESVSEVLTAAAESANAGTEAEHNSHCVCGAVHQATGTHTTEQSETWVGVDTLNDITDAGHYYLTQDVTLTGSWTPKDGTVLCLNGHTITQEAYDYVITVGDGVKFTLTDCEPKGEAGKVTHASGITGTGVYVQSNSEFTMYGGSITGHKDSDTNRSVLGSVRVEGKFYMRGGSITDNDIAYGGGVYVKGGTFCMYDNALISNNKATAPKGSSGTDYGGGGVYVESGKFTMYGGSITGNKAESTASSISGGGVLVKGGTFTMQGGTIHGNEVWSYGWNAYGGGVFVGNGAVFNMTGGSITGNYAFASSGGSNGGGVGVDNGGTFTMYNGTITGNSAVKGGSNSGGVYANGTFKVYGATITENYVGGELNKETGLYEKGSGWDCNVYLPDGKTIDASGLTPYARIGVTTRYALSDSRTSITIATGATADRSGCFISDRGYYPVYDETNEEIRLEKNKPHVHYLCGGDTCTKVGHDEETNMATFKAWSEKTSLPSGAGYYYLTENVELSETWKINGDAGRKVVLCLNGHTIKMQNSGAVINVLNDRSLTLTDCSEGEAGKVTHEAGKAGGGVTVTTGGTFTLYGGSITGNETGTGQGGGGVLVSGTFNMCGGSISGNGTAKGYGGGGVYVYGTFNMSGGSISGNNANGNGGGVFVDEGTFELENGSITGNNAGDGGGVYVDTNGTFTMSGGSITGNQTSYSGGGGVYVRGTFELEGGSSITGNYAGGTLNEKSGLYEKGENGKDNNVFLPSGKTIDASRLDATGGTIGVTTAVKPTGGNPVAIANAQYQNQLSRFVSDEGYHLEYDADSGKIQLEIEPHVHYLCGGDSCTQVGHGQENDKTKFTAWSEKNSLPSEDGNYYLTEDVELSSTWTLQTSTRNVVLCLNGHTIIQKTDNTGVITVMNGGRSLTLTDCAPEGKVGKVTHEAGKTGRGVYVSIGSTFTLYGGSITGNKTATSYGGGGVYVYGGTFNMCGGSVSGNEAGSNGGGVYVDIGTFNMYGGGSISGNNANGNGGGVYVNISKTGATSTFTMSGGSISGNNATDYSGGGVCVKDGTFKLQNGSITRNYADGTLNTESGVYEKGENGKGSNVYLYSGKTIDVSKLEANAGKIGVTTADTPADGKPVAIATGAKDGVDYGSIFTPDVKDKDYTITRVNDKVYLTAHTHDWAYSVSTDGKTISAACSSCGESGGSVTIKEPAEPTYSGEEKECWRYLDEWDVETPSSTTITYQAWNGQAWKACGTPVNAGKYKGILTAADGVASVVVEFEIGKATPVVTGSGTATGTYGQKVNTVKVEGLTATLNGKPVAGSWVLTDTNDTLDTVTNGSTIEYTAVFTPTDATNYNTAEAKVAVTVNPKPGGSFSPVALTQKFTDTAVKTYQPDWSGLPTGEDWKYESSVSSSNDSITVRNDIDYNTGKLTYSISGGQAGDTVTFTLKATCGHYEPFTITLVVTLTDRDPQSGFGFASDAKTVTYGDGDFTMAATGNVTGSSVTYKSSDAAVATVDDSGKVRIVGAGTATITAAATATDEYAAATASYTLTVQKKALTITGVTVASKTYDGTTDATITGVTFDGLKDGDTLALGTDYTVSGAFNSANVKDANKVTATVTLKAKNYTLNGNTFTMNASIGKADPSYSAPAVSTVYGVGKTLADVTLPAGWSWMDTAKSVGDASTTAKTFKARYTPDDTDNYNVVDGIDVQLTVNKAPAPAESGEDVRVEVKYTVTEEWTIDLSKGIPGAECVVSTSTGDSDNRINATKNENAIITLKLTGVGQAGETIELSVRNYSTNYEDVVFKVYIHLTAKDDQAALELSGGDSVVYGETLTFSAKGGSGSGKVTYSVVNGTGEATIDADTGVLTTVKAGKVKVKAVKAGDANFNEVTSNEIEVTIQQAACTGESRFDKITSGNKTLADVGLTIVDGEGNTIPGTLKWLDAEGNVLPNDTVVERNKTYKWRFTPADGNYAELTGDVEPYHVSPSGGRSTPTVDVTKLPLLRTGSTGEYVKYLQERLNTLGYNCGDVDGIFGKRTHAAVTEFQRNNGLSVDGIVGPLTWGKLGVEYLPAPSGSTGSAVDAALPLLRTGSTGEYVKRLQRRLNELGYSCGDVDGIFGSKTYAAVTAFQKVTGLSIDGVVGPLTWTKLG